MASILGLTYRGMDGEFISNHYARLWRGPLPAIANILPGVNYRVCVPTNIPPFFFAYVPTHP